VQADGHGETEQESTEKQERFSFNAQSFPSLIKFIRNMEKKINVVMGDNQELRTDLKTTKGELASTKGELASVQQQLTTLSEQMKQQEQQQTQQKEREQQQEQQQVQERVEAVKIAVREELEQLSTFTSQQTQKITAIAEIATQAAHETEEKMRIAAVAGLEAQIKAKADRIQNVEGRVDKLEEQQGEAVTAAPAAAAQQDLPGELAQLKETVKQQEMTLNKISTQYMSCDATLAEVKMVGSRVEKVERQVADNNSKAEAAAAVAAAAAEKQEKIRVSPSVVVVMPKGEAAAAVAGVNDAISRGMQEAEDKEQRTPKDLSYTTRPFGFGGTGSWNARGRISYNSGSSSNSRSSGSGSSGHSSSSSSTVTTHKQWEKILMTFPSPEAADFFLRHCKKKLPVGIYAEPLLTVKEAKAKKARMPEYLELKAQSKQVTWHRACLVEYIKGEGRGAGRWREIGAMEGHKKSEGRAVGVPPGGKVWVPVVRKAK